MSTTQTSTSTRMPEVGTVDIKLEVVTVPVSDVDQTKEFYQTLGWRLDADIAARDSSGSSTHAAALGVLGRVRQGRHYGRAGLGSPPDPGRR